METLAEVIAAVEQLQHEQSKQGSRLNTIEQESGEQQQECERLLVESKRAQDWAKHAYRVDHCGYIWVWDVDSKEYKKTQMRVHTPELPDDSVTSEKLKDASVISGKIADNAVSTAKIDNDAVTPEKLSPSVLLDVVMPAVNKGKEEAVCYYEKLTADFRRAVEKILNDFKNMVDSLDAGGVALSNEFGDKLHIGISQKTLTDAITRIWSKLEDITGEAMMGINMIVSPTYFISEDGCKVHISATSADANGVFERIAFYANGELVPIEGYEDGIAKNCDSCTAETTIDETTEIKCVAKILGIEYTKVKTVTHYNNFFLFTGQFEDLSGIGQFMADHPEYARPVSNGMRGVYDVTCNEGDKIYVVVGSKLSGFLRADINSVEIPFNMTEQEYEKPDGTTETFRVFKSVNSYHAGSYNIDING